MIRGLLLAALGLCAASSAEAQDPVDAAPAAIADAAQAATGDASPGAALDGSASADGGVPLPASAPLDAAVALDSGAHDGAAAGGDAGTADAGATHELPDLERTTGIVVATVLGLAAIVLLVWLASHPRVRKLEEMLGVRQVITSGLVFVLLGWIAGRDGLGVLSDEVLHDLTPVLHFALGWIGLSIGFQFDVRALDRLPKGTALTVAIESVVPFVCVGVVGAALLVALGEPWRDELFLRHAIALGAAGAISVVALRDRLPPWQVETEADVRARIDSLDEIAGVAALALIGAFFRPTWVDWRWELPGTVWLFLTLGMGAAVGLIAYVMVRSKASTSEFLALTLGIVALGSGMAGYVFLSPVVVCFCAGAVVSNLPSETRATLWSILMRVERPMYFLLLTVAGALWDPSDWRGWVLMLLFVAARAGGTLLGRTMLDRSAATGAPVRRTTDSILRPISPVSIAIVVSLQATYVGEPIGWIVTAVIGGAIVTEVLAQLRDRNRTRGRELAEERKS